MKKLLISVLIILCAQQVYAEDIEVIIDDEIQPLEDQPIMNDQHTMLPLKHFMNHFGYQVTWQPEEQQVVCQRGEHLLKLNIGNPIYMNDEHMIQLETFPMIINDRTYVPLDFFDNIANVSVSYDEELSSITFEESLDYVTLLYQNGDYKHFKANQKQLGIADQVVYQWARFENTENRIEINTTSKNNNTMFYPSGHELVTQPIDHRLLGIYFESDALFTLSHLSNVVKEIKSLVVTPGLDDPDFEGIQIHVNNINDDKKVNGLLKAIHEALPNIEVNVSIGSRDFTKIDLAYVDHLILDFSKELKPNDITVNLNPEYVEKPNADIQVLADHLDFTLKDVPHYLRDKIILKVNLNVVVWQGKTFYETKRIDSNYETILSRKDLLNYNAFGYNETAKQPYIVFEENGLKNTIWYENSTSINEKIKLVKALDLGGIAFDHIGQLPLGSTEELDQFNINFFNDVLD